VKDLGAQGQIALRPGYVAVVSRAASLRSALVAALFPGPDDLRRLVDGEGPPGWVWDSSPATALPTGCCASWAARGSCRSSTPRARSSPRCRRTTWRSSRSSGRVRPAPADHYFSFFVLESNELPPRAPGGVTGADAVVDNAKVQALKAGAGADQALRGSPGPALQGAAAPLRAGRARPRFRDAQDRPIPSRPSWRGLLGRRSR